MGENSIRNLLSKDDAISEIRLIYNEDIEKKHLFIIVEGIGDFKLLRKLFSDDSIIFESYSGKHGVVEIVENEIFRKCDRLLGICDRDYHCVSDDIRILYYDCCCMEMMIVKDDEVFSSIYYEFYFGEMNYSDLRNKIMSELRVLSSFRRANEEKDLRIKLKGISLGSAWDKERRTLDNGKIMDTIKRINPQSDIDSVTKSVELYDQENWSDEDYYNYTQGHDFFELFSLICNSYDDGITNKGNLESNARCKYGINQFLSTDLCKSIYDYALSIQYEGVLFNCRE